MQLLEETSGVLSLGKLCEDHGYSHEWVSGQKARLTKDGKTIICKTDNFVPLVVPCLSAIPESSASSASLSQDSLRREAEQAPRELVQPAASSSSGSVLERSDVMAPGNWCDPSTQNKNRKRDDRKNSDDPLADLPEWLEGFKKSLVETKIASIRTQFLGIRSRTSYESGNKITGSTILKVTSRKTGIATYA